MRHIFPPSSSYLYYPIACNSSLFFATLIHGPNNRRLSTAATHWLIIRRYISVYHSERRRRLTQTNIKICIAYFLLARFPPPPRFIRQSDADDENDETRGAFCFVILPLHLPFLVSIVQMHLRLYNKTTAIYSVLCILSQRAI